MSGAPIQLFENLLLIAAIVCAVTLVRLLQRNEGIGRGYAFVVGGELLLAIMAMGGDRFIGTIALGLVSATVVLPWLLEHGSRWAFARGRLSMVARLSSLRASLMLGSGLARQLPILEGLALLDRKGIDAAIAHFRKLADEAEDAQDLAIIHEQIVAMLFHGQRWDEGIAHYERRFKSGYAAVRPALALSLLRAYGEAGRLDNAARLLRELEEGPIGADPNTAELLGQARLTFLAYAGAVGPVDEIVEQRQFEELGLSPATAELFLGIAHARAGEAQAARETLSKVELLAGPRDRRIREAARAVLEKQLGGLLVEDGGRGPAAIDVSPELRGYVELVARQLRQRLADMPALRRSGRPRAGRAVIALLWMFYGMHLLLGGGGIGLLELGALSRDGLAGQAGWARPLTSTWLHADLLGLLFDSYAIWLSGQIVERLLGPARMLLVTVVAGLLGSVASVLALAWLEGHGLAELAVLAPTGGNLIAVGATTAALWSLTRRRTPMLLPRSRRNLGITFALLLLANLLMSWPTVVGVSIAPVGLFTTVVFASLVVLALPRELPRWTSNVFGVLLGAVLALNVGAAIAVLGDDPQAWLVEQRSTVCELEGVRVRTPSDVAPMRLDRDVPFALPIVDGVLDTLELRDGMLVQLAVASGEASEQPALFALVEGLEHELSVSAVGSLPEAFAALLGDDQSGDASGQWRAFDLWRNGERVGRVVERRLEGRTLMVVASPAEALAHAGDMYAAIMREAIVVEPGHEGCRRDP